MGEDDPSGDQHTCPNCSQTVESLYSCPECGEEHCVDCRLHRAHSRDGEQAEASDRGQGIRDACPQCGADTPDHGSYCPECGADIHAPADASPTAGSSGDRIQTRDRCHVCQAAIPSGDETCPECGANVTYRADQESPTGSGSAPVTESESDDEGGYFSRRVMLIGGGGLLVGGGSLVASILTKPEHQVYGEGWDVERQQTNSAVQLEGSVTIPSGRYAVRSANPSLSAEYEIDFEAVENGPIDVFVMDDGEYDRYRDRDDSFQLSLQEVNSNSGTLRGTLSPGEYRIVFDNTGVFGADPSGETVVDLTITARI